MNDLNQESFVRKRWFCYWLCCNKSVNLACLGHLGWEVDWNFEVCETWLPSCYRLLFIVSTWWQYKMRQDIFLPIRPDWNIFRKSLCVCFQNLLKFVNYIHGIHQCFFFPFLCGTFMEIKKSEHSSKRIVFYSNRYKQNACHTAWAGKPCCFITRLQTRCAYLKINSGLRADPSLLASESASHSKFRVVWGSRPLNHHAFELHLRNLCQAFLKCSCLFLFVRWASLGIRATKGRSTVVTKAV